MKFLYLKGVDILGPFEAEQIKKESCFSDELLVCPEDKAEQEAAWKPASQYPQFNNIAKEEATTLKKEEPIVDITLPSQSYLSQEKPNISTDLPPLEDTETDSSTFEKDGFDDKFNDVMEELSSEAKEEETLEEDFQDHTFRLASKDDNLLEDLPAHSLLGPDEDDKSGEVPGANQDINSSVGKDIGAVKEISNVHNDKEFIEISNNKIISSSDGRVNKRRSNDLIFILSFVVLMVVATALCMAFWNMMRDEGSEIGTNIASQNEEHNDSYSSEESQDLTSEAIEPKSYDQETVSSEEFSEPKPNIEEQVIDIVKNTRLAKKGETIEEYLHNTYGMEYQSSWSAKPFTDNVYIVEFFASQVRKEPFVYLFRVDVDQKKITGALNNITLDLIS